MRSGNAVSSHGGLILFETVYAKRGGLICFDWLLDLPQVDLKSFLASGASSFGREAPKRATKSRQVDLSRLRGCHLRFPPNMESGVTGKEVAFSIQSSFYWWFSHDVTKIQTKKLSILRRFYFHDALEQLKTNFHTNFRLKKVLGFVMEYAWISKLLSDAAFTWRPRELSCRLKKWLISGNFAI